MLKDQIRNFKKIMEPIKVVKNNFFRNFLLLSYERLSSVFNLQVMALIIASIENKNLDSFYFYIILLSILIFLGFVVYLGLNWTWNKVDYGVEKYLTKKYLGDYIYLDNNRIQAYGVGRSSNVIYNGITNQKNLILETISNSIIDIMAILYSFLIIAINVKFSWFMIFLLIFLLGNIFMYYSFSKSQKFRKYIKNISIEIDRWKTKILMSKFEIFQNNKYPNESKIYTRKINKQFSHQRKADKTKVFWQFGSKGLIETVRILMYLIIGLGVIMGKYEIAYLVLLTGLLGEVNYSIYGIRQHIKSFAEGIVHVEKMRDMFENIPKIDDDKDKNKFEFQKGDIIFDKVYFSYTDENFILKNFNLEIKGGKKTALVGPSGSGKSTIIKLIGAYLYTKKGLISVDDQIINSLSLKSYYKHIGYLTQDPGVFDGTIIDNLTYALKKKPTNAQLEKVIKMSKCEFIKDFKKGLKTEIGERGVRLSGGQKQRLAIAKIMLKDPKIILLDEPTSALDSVSEQKISQALHNLFKGKTVIIIAHRLQTVKQADEIIVIDKGKVVDRGTHKQLEKRKGLYKQMLDLQTTF